MTQWHSFFQLSKPLQFCCTISTIPRVPILLTNSLPLQEMNLQARCLAGSNSAVGQSLGGSPSHVL